MTLVVAGGIPLSRDPPVLCSRFELRRGYLSRSWIHPALEAGHSRIHGWGVLASAPLKRGQKLMEFGGHAIAANRLTTDEFRIRSVWLVREGLYLALRENDPLPSLDENLNHSCDANGWLSDEVTLVARRDIAAAEEITLDQGTWNFDDKEYVWDQRYCSCGARVCRRKLTPIDWKLNVVRGRYRGHFHPCVQRLIDRQRSLPDSGRRRALASFRFRE